MPTEISSPIDTVPWNRLLRDIHNRQVLPVIGPGLVVLEDSLKAATTERGFSKLLGETST